MRIIASPAYRNKSVNPYNYLLYMHISELGVEVEDFSISKVLKEKWDIWHIHWPEGYLNRKSLIKSSVLTTSLMGMIQFLRMKGVKVVWTAHNITTHERYHPKIEEKFWKVFTRQINGYITLSKTGKLELLKRYPHLRDVPGFVIPHGHYRGIYPNYVSKEKARELLDLPLDSIVITFIGQIRKYKNVPHLIRVFCEIPDKNIYLVIAGKPSNQKIKRQIRISTMKCSDRIRTYLRFIPKEEVQIFLNSADLIVLPYSEIYHSGTALLALSFNRPVLVPNRGAMWELQMEVGKKWVMIYEPELTPHILEQAIDWAINTNRQSNAPLSQFNWEKIAKMTIKAYERILESP
ncbi:glycosyltransferase [Thermococcus chitonophagus]|uniref:Glycosyltransferase n=1 Tax=Thermococcus chitonophagus TaxID=54262 RepID=A0A160VQZ3_9EURY|nr:glycosyltransferase [Thermococcus chitonophagus]ASJ16047.1 glycosyltransferase [Thermococcus chitonophagus]CUX77295.1 Glycosyltransferase [Thermococcus chitonophagus]